MPSENISPPEQLCASEEGLERRLSLLAPRRFRPWAAALVVACLLPSAFMAWGGRDMPALGQMQDDSIYWQGAKALAQGDGYRITSLPAKPWQTKYPPLFPLCLSLVWRISPKFPENLPLATLFCWLWMPVWLALGWRALRDLGLERGPALGLYCAMAVNPVAIFYSTITVTELMASALWLAAAVLASNCRTRRVAFAAGVIAGAAYLTKTAALPLLVAAPLFFVLRRRYRLAVAVIAGMLPFVLGWNFWVHTHLSPTSDPLLLYYTDYFHYQLYNVDLRSVPALLLTNANYLLQGVGNLLLGPGEFIRPDQYVVAAILMIATRTICVLTIAGWIGRIRRQGLLLYDLFAAMYVLLLLVWHYPPNERFLFPLLPILLAGCWEGLRVAGRMLRPRIPALPGIAASLAVAVCLWMATCSVVYFNFIRQSRETLRHNRAVYAWILRNTPPDTIFVTHDDVVLYLYTGRTGYRPIVPTRFLYRGDPQGAEEYVRTLPEFARRRHARYILSGPRDWLGEYLPTGLPVRSHQILAANGLPVDFRSNGVTLYRVDTPDNAR